MPPITNRFAVIAMLFAGLLSSNTIAAPADELVITEAVVNLREQPSAESKILLKLAQDRRLIEIKREGEWVEVYTDRDDIGSGWVHASLVAPVPDYDTAITNHTESFKKFTDAFAKLNESWKQPDGTLPFTRVDEYINRRIKLTTTTEWLQTDQTQREQILTQIFDLWGDAVGSEKSIEIIILMPDGTPTMSMFR